MGADSEGSKPSEESPDPTLVAAVNQSVGTATTQFEVLKALMSILDPETIDAERFLDLMAAVGISMNDLGGIARTLGKPLGLSSGKDRIRAYLLAHVGEIVTTYELNGVAGIQESPRRIRELHVEEGLQISAGPGNGLKNGEYRLEETDLDLAAAQRWKLRNTVRRSGGSITDRCLAWLQAIYPETASKEDMVYVAIRHEYPRRIRELAEAGWDIISSNDDPNLPPGSYRLGSNVQGIPRSRKAIKQRTSILQRDCYRCSDCGKSPSTDPGTVLQIHHLHHVNEGGGNDDLNLVTLCSNCHAGRHAVSAVANEPAPRDDLMDPSYDSWTRTS